jgi:hypothetical protein
LNISEVVPLQARQENNQCLTVPSLSPTRRPSCWACTRAPVEIFEALLDEGSELWVDHAEFAAFIAKLRRWRIQERQGNRSP